MAQISRLSHGGKKYTYSTIYPTNKNEGLVANPRLRIAEGIMPEDPIFSGFVVMKESKKIFHRWVYPIIKIPCHCILILTEGE